jgi:ABC-type polar amino acid transport system ATPase subunit
MNASSLNASPLISLTNVSKRYGSNPVLRDCSLTVERGEIVVVCGPSGSGKSTLIKTINGLEPYQSGTVSFEGKVVGDRSTDLPRLRARIGMVFQSFELYPHMTALKNVMLAQVHVLKRSRAEAEARALELLAKVGLSERAHAFPANLSGGQQQRVAIARALALDPIAMLFDEPTSALDPEMINEVLDVMVSLAREGMTMVVVTHEMGFARRVASRVVFMDEGRIVEDRPSDEFFSAPDTERARAFLSKIIAH